MSPRFAAMLRALGVDVKALREDFPENTIDVDLFRLLKGRNITIVGPDMRQLTRPHEAKELKAAGISALYFGPFWPKMELWPQASWLIRHWPTLDAFMSAGTKGTVAEAQQNGRVRAIPI